MADADLDVVVRPIREKEVKALTDAARKRHGRFMGMAARAKDKESRERYRHLATGIRSCLRRKGGCKSWRRIKAYSYARSIRKAAEECGAAKPGKKSPRRKKGLSGTGLLRSF